jgi:medium-chain acyl-[acyl-carrier-protein] hydrolase
MKGVLSKEIISDWVTFPRPAPQARLRLFCFPYAGGNAMIYRSWPMGLPPTVEICAVQLPGHGSRLGEPAFDRLVPLVQALAPQLYPYLDKPYAFFGHSMGAIISFELARLLRKEHRQGPARLFVSGHREPRIKDAGPTTFDLPMAEFIERLRRLNGTPKEVLEHPELINLMTPVLRADFAISETYEYIDEKPLECDLTAFGGVGDIEVTRKHLEAWRLQTSANFNLRMFPGDHFFLNTARPSLLQALSLDLERAS